MVFPRQTAVRLPSAPAHPHINRFQTCQSDRLKGMNSVLAQMHRTAGYNPAVMIVEALEADLNKREHPLLAPRFARKVLIQGAGRAVTSVPRLRRVLQSLVSRPANADTMNALAMILARRDGGPGRRDRCACIERARPSRRETLFPNSIQECVICNGGVISISRSRTVSSCRQVDRKLHVAGASDRFRFGRDSIDGAFWPIASTRAEWLRFARRANRMREHGIGFKQLTNAFLRCLAPDRL
jgi:hypothetical protein